MIFRAFLITPYNIGGVWIEVIIWGHGDIDVDINRTNNFNRVDVNNVKSNRQNWQHNSANRKGVAYRDNATAHRYGQSPARSMESRQSRGYGVVLVSRGNLNRGVLSHRGKAASKGNFNRAEVVGVPTTARGAEIKPPLAALAMERASVWRVNVARPAGVKASKVVLVVVSVAVVAGDE